MLTGLAIYRHFLANVLDVVACTLQMVCVLVNPRPDPSALNLELRSNSLHCMPRSEHHFVLKLLNCSWDSLGGVGPIVNSHLQWRRQIFMSGLGQDGAVRRDISLISDKDTAFLITSLRGRHVTRSVRFYDILDNFLGVGRGPIRKWLDFGGKTDSFIYSAPYRIL